MSELLAQTSQLTQPGGQTQQFLSSLAQHAAAGVPNTPTEDQQLNNAITSTTAQQTQLGTPQGRQSYLDNTNLAPAQANLDQLAAQLQQYDQVKLMPQYTGTNPGLPPEMSRISGYFNPNLSYAGNGNLTPDQSIYNANPGYALTAQANQGGNIGRLMDTVLGNISSQYKMGTDQYSNDLNKTNNQLDTLFKLLGLSNNLKIEQAKAASSASSKGLTALQQRQLLAQELQSVQGKDLHVSPADYARIKNGASLLGVSTQDFDSWFSGYRNPDQAKLFPQDTYEVDPAALTSQERTANQKAAEAQTASTNLNGFADQIMTNWEKMGSAEKAVGVIPGVNQVGALAPNIVKNDAIFYDQIIKELKAKIGGRLTNQEILFFKNQIPGPLDTADTAQYKINTLKGLVAQKLANPDASVGANNTAQSQTRIYNGATYIKVNGGWQKQK